MKISIITPSYNQVDYIGRTIESIISQKGDFELEYIIVDGNSNDGSVEVIRSYGERDERIQWVSEPDNGQSDAINKGLRKATGDVVAFLNSDDMYKPGALQAIAEQVQRHPEAHWFTGYCDIVDADDVTNGGLVTQYKNFWLRHFSKSVLMVLNPISQPATFWRREALKATGFINEDEHLVMDYEYWCRLAQNYRLYVVPQYLASFRITADTKSNTQTTKQFTDEIRVADTYTRNPLLRLFHRLHVAALLLSYKVIR